MSFSQKKTLNQTRKIFVASCDGIQDTLQHENVSPRNRITTVDNKKLSSESFAKEPTGNTDGNRQGKQSTVPATDLNKDKTGAFATGNPFAFQDPAINNHCHTEGHQNSTEAKNADFNQPKDNTSEIQINNDGQIIERPHIELTEEEQKMLASAGKTTETYEKTKRQEEKEAKDSSSLDEMVLPEEINLTYSRYNGKKAALSKYKTNTKPGRPDTTDDKDKTKSKSKAATTKGWFEDDEAYHITMAGHMPEVSITDDFCGTGDVKHTTKKENKKEILARLKKASIYKLFNRPTKVKKFKIEEEKPEGHQQKQKKGKGIRQAIRRFVRNLRNRLRGCICGLF